MEEVGNNNFIIELLASDVDTHAAELIGGQVGLFTGCEIILSMVSTMSVTEMTELLAAASGVESVTQDGPVEQRLEGFLKFGPAMNFNTDLC